MPRRIYEDAIANWPAEDRPREKLIRQGPDHLTNIELLAILVRVGVRGKSAVDLARSLLRELQDLGTLDAMDATELCQIRGLSFAKTAQIKAGIELGKRIVAEKKRSLSRVYSSQEVFAYLMPRLRNLRHEEFIALYLNARNEILDEVVISRGSLTSSAVYPREIINRGYRAGAAASVFAHNHPSGSISPSAEDRRVTRELVFAGEVAQVPVMDHIIVGKTEYFSFADDGFVPRCKQEYRRFIMG